MADLKENQPSMNGSNTNDGNSLPSKKGNPDSLLYPTSAKYARRRKQRNIALIVGGVGAVGVLMLGVIAFLGRVSGVFTIKMDPRIAPSTMKLFDKVDGDSKELLTASGLANAHVTTAETVFTEVDKLKTDNDLNGSHNLSQGTTSDGESIDTALVFTFYAENVSDTEDAVFDYSLVIDDYTSPTNSAVQPYSYLRVAIYENLYDPEGNGSHDCTIYALESINENAAGDYRECLSTYRTVDSKKKPTYKYGSGDGYCEPFADNYTVANKTAITLPAQKILRYTIVAWFEGNDPDCYGSAPEGSSITLSMSFSAH